MTTHLHYKYPEFLLFLAFLVPMLLASCVFTQSSKLYPLDWEEHERDEALRRGSWTVVRDYSPQCSTVSIPGGLRNITITNMNEHAVIVDLTPIIDIYEMQSKPLSTHLYIYPYALPLTYIEAGGVLRIRLLSGSLFTEGAILFVFHEADCSDEYQSVDEFHLCRFDYHSRHVFDAGELYNNTELVTLHLPEGSRVVSSMHDYFEGEERGHPGPALENGVIRQRK